MIDTDTLRWLRANGLSDAEPLGSGGEAQVFRSSDTEVVRLTRPGVTRADARARMTLLKRISDGAKACDFETPEVLSLLESDGRVATLERLIPGRPLEEALRNANRPARETMIAAWLDAALQVARIEIGGRGYGGLLDERDGGHASFHDCWERRLGASLATRGELYRDVDVAGIARAMPEPARPALAHLDLFAGNLLWHEGRISGVLDFGYSTILGDGRLNCLFAAVFALSSPRAAEPGDEGCVRAWLRAHRLEDYLPAAERMVAAYWSFVDDDPPLDAWCREVLLHGRSRFA